MTWPLVIILGGGPAGCATALSIARHDTSNQLRVLVIDDADPDAFKVGESLPAAAKRTLSLLDPSLLSRITEDTKLGLHLPCTGNASAWASERLHETYSLMNPYGEGWHLDRARFDETLREACQDGVRKGKFVAIRRMDGPEASYGWEVDVEMRESGELDTFCTGWVVDATGRRASVARKLGATQRKTHDLLAFYIVFSTPDSDASQPDRDDRTLIEAAPSGWWYTARLPHNKRLVTYTTTPSDPTARVARTTTGFTDMLASQTQHIARALAPVYEACGAETRFTRCTAAGSSVLEPYAVWEPPTHPLNPSARGRGWCAVGDAALAFDPLSSQGIITSLNSGLSLGALLARHLCPLPLPPSENADTASGEAVVEGITAAYEGVREKYGAGRAHYYGIVRRFDAGDASESESAEGADAEAGFWRAQRGG
ncbi:FAD/NAD-P-binding domain-containing protein [Trametes versicolor FP-101664 SS1]|uniref:FAD/NAD-P-binding domain-containing protein n=1 Tax=Trametes versicolor (strain FP-101664) TaxID=717944 RepID=UPI00046233DB|nr:FAD/NAD-P-binding domain-containing protein [Trametes versicolor FP-101664 SS1]EIW65208.1 FAD/NAD-P-binding domain-containing protein [Trametes versicolor FP-101664 SS1]